MAVVKSTKNVVAEKTKSKDVMDLIQIEQLKYQMKEVEASIKEAERLGFKEIIIPRNNYKQKKHNTIKVTEVGHLTELYSIFFSSRISV